MFSEYTVLRWGIEGTALVAGLMYILCARMRSNYSWIFGILSAVCIIVVDVRYTQLYFDAILHFFFMAMSAIGIFLWSKDQTVKKQKDIRISSMTWASYGGYMMISLLIAGAAGYLWDQQTDGAFPYVDCFQMMLSIFATFLIMYCVIQAWSYWILVDILSIWLYTMTGAYLLAILYIAYLISNAYQWRLWSQVYKSGRRSFSNIELGAPH